MNVTEYLASGIVELYAMNALSPEEKKEFERLMILYPEIASELRKTEHLLEEYAFAHSLNPRPQLRTRIMDEVRQNGKVNKSKPAEKKIQSNNSHTLTYKYMIAASLAALVVSTFASWFFYTRWDEAEEHFSTLLNEKNELAQNYNLVKAAYDETVSGLIVMRDQNTNVIVLKSTDTTSNYQARIYWNNQTKRSYIDVLLLPVPDEEKQFQLWALSGNQVKDAGVFSVGTYGLQRVKDVSQADSWCVTLEPKGGSTTPALNQMILVSKASR